MSGVIALDTLVILIGASEWPEAEKLKSSEAFKNSAQQIKNYFIGNLGVPVDNLLDYFDSEKGQEEILRDIEAFVKNHTEQRKKSTDNINPITDLILYFTGHGGFEGAESDYYLAIRHTTASNFSSSAIGIKSLAKTLKNCAGRIRQLIIIDACFAASATNAFQGPLEQTAVLKTNDAFYENGISLNNDMPEWGVTILCSSSSHVPSKIAEDGVKTMFSDALINTLLHGDRKAPKYLSIADVSVLSWGYLSVNYKNEAPRPEVHSPNQSKGDISKMPYFPNSAVAKKKTEYKKFENIENSIQCCLIMSETEQDTKVLQSLIEVMLLDYKDQILNVSGKSKIIQSPHVIKVSDAFSSAETYNDILTALCQCDVAVFDATNYEPAVMFLLGVRSVVRRGINIVSIGGDYIMGDAIDFPFNVREINFVSHSTRQNAIKDPIQIIGERIIDAFKQLDSNFNYLDLPAYDAVRNFRSDTIIQATKECSEQILLLCPFSSHYQQNNWAQGFKRYLPIYVKDSLRGENITRPAYNPEIVRTLDMKSSRLVSQSLYEAIRFTKMCVVDWSEWNPNVFFELGVRVSISEIQPICVIEKAYKKQVTSIAIDEKTISNHEVKTLSRPIKLQCLMLLEWFNPIEYNLFSTSGGHDAESFKNIVAFYHTSRTNNQTRYQPISFIERDSTFNIISSKIDWNAEIGSKQVYHDLINMADMLNGPNDDSQGISPVLYPQNLELVQSKNQGAIERRIAAWLYIKNRYSLSEIVEDENISNTFEDLSNLILSGLSKLGQVKDKPFIKLVYEDLKDFKEKRI